MISTAAASHGIQQHFVINLKHLRYNIQQHPIYSILYS